MTDTLIYNKYVFGLCPIHWHSAPISPWSFLSLECNQGLFYYVHEGLPCPLVTEDWSLVAREASHLIRGLEGSVSPPDPPGREEGLEI